jgi:IS605 OrfB family transposase
LEVNLSFDGQAKKLAKFIQALTPIPKSETAKGTQPCAAPISWRIWIEGDPNTPRSCKVYVRAQLKVEDAQIISFASSGCLGLDINAWGVSTAWCNAEGNKPRKDYGSYVHDVKIDWKDKSSNQTLHAVRVAAKKMVDGCARLGSILAIEALDFSDKKKSLRYEDPGRAKQLSGFAYQKLIEAIEARAKKVGVEVRKVDPAYTSVIGWAKYGSKLGLNPDQAAAFAIARRGILSKGDAIKRRKIKGEWIDLYSKKENLTEFQKLELKSDLKSEESKTKKAQRRGPQQSMRVSKSSSESNLARALGSDRRLWAGKLAELRKSLAKGKLVLREDDSALEAGQAAKASKGTRVPMKEKKRGLRPASTLL